MPESFGAAYYHIHVCLSLFPPSIIPDHGLSFREPKSRAVGANLVLPSLTLAMIGRSGEDRPHPCIGVYFQLFGVLT